MLHNGMIIAEISKRARIAVGLNAVPSQELWLATGKAWIAELRNEGLNDTADTVEKHLRWFEDKANVS